MCLELMPVTNRRERRVTINDPQIRLFGMKMINNAFPNARFDLSQVVCGDLRTWGSVRLKKTHRNVSHIHLSNQAIQYNAATKMA